MQFFIFSLTTLFVIFHHWRATADGISGLRREIFSEEANVLKKFFIKLQEEVANADLGYVTFLGGSNEQLVLAKPLMKNHPYLIGENMQDVVTANLKHYSDGFVFLFLTRMHKDYVKCVLKDIRSFIRIKLYFVYQNAATNDEINAVLSPAGDEIGGNIYTTMYPRLFLHNHEGKIRLYAREFSINCSPELVMLMDLSPAATFENISKVHSRPLDYKGCSGIVLTRFFPPRMILKEESNGTLKITGGSEGNMVLTIAQLTKFSPQVHLLNGFNQRNSIDAAFAGIAFQQPMLMAVDQIRYTGDLDNFVDYSRMYSQHCAVWCVPKITKWSYNVILGEFSGESWILIMTIFGIVIAIAGFIQSQHSTATDRMQKVSEFCAMAINFYSMSLGNPSPRVRPSGRWRAFMTFFFLYSLVTTTAYKSSLASIIATENGRSVIVDAEGILKANLTTGGDITGLILLRDQSRESKTIRELMTRYQVYNDTMAAIRRVAVEKDFAFLTSRNDLDYYIKTYSETNNAPLPFDLIDDCVLTYGTGIVMPKGTPLLTTVNNIIRYLAESGHLAHWQKNELHHGTENTAKIRDKGYEAENFYQILVVCAISLTASILAFFGEIIYHRIKSHRKFF